MTCCNDGLMGDHLAISGAGGFTGPLNPLKTDVSRGPPGLPGGPGLRAHRNSTTASRSRPVPSPIRGGGRDVVDHIVGHFEQFGYSKRACWASPKFAD